MILQACTYTTLLQELANHGPAKPADKQGLDEYTNEDGSLKTDEGVGTVDAALVAKYEHYCADPTGQRNGDAPAKEVAAVILKQCEEAETCASEKQVDNKVCLTVEMLKGQIDLLRGAVTIAYPMGLPDNDAVRALIEGPDGMSGAGAQEVLDHDSAGLWWAGKLLVREKKLSDFVGRNDKTKIVAKLQKGGASAPSRERAIDEETQKRMMAHYHRKQEEMKKLEEDEDDSYTHSAWANPKSLKSSFHGLGEIRA